MDMADKRNVSYKLFMYKCELEGIHKFFINISWNPTCGNALREVRTRVDSNVLRCFEEFPKNLVNNSFSDYPFSNMELMHESPSLEELKKNIPPQWAI